MLKTLLAGTTAIAIAGASLAFAQTEPARFDHKQRWQPTAQDRAPFSDARIAALHAGLQLNAEQEKNWPAIESALRDLAKQRSERIAARASADKPTDPIARLAFRAQALQQRGTALKKLADAVAPLYKTLDDGQKHRFAMLARLGARNHARHHEWQQNERRHHGPRGPMMQDDESRPQ